jgi:hypothetical protein
MIAALLAAQALLFTIPYVYAQTHTIVSATRVGGGSTFTSNPTINEFTGGYSVTLAFQEGTSSVADDPHNPSNAPASGATSGGAQYRFVIQDSDSTHNPVGIATAGDNVEWSYDSSTKQLTITLTNARMAFESGVNLIGVAFSVFDSFTGDPSAFFGTSSLNDIGGTIMTNAQSFSLSFSGKGIWDLTATARSGTSGYFKIFITSSMLSALGSSVSDVDVLINGVTQIISPVSTSGKISKGGSDKPGILISVPLSFSTKTVKTDMSPSAKAQLIEVTSDQATKVSSFAGAMAGLWGTTSDAVVQRVNEGIAVANQLFPSTVGQPFGIYSSGGNIIAGKGGGYIEVVFGGTSPQAIYISYGADGRITASQSTLLKVKS